MRNYFAYLCLVRKCHILQAMLMYYNNNKQFKIKEMFQKREAPVSISHLKSIEALPPKFGKPQHIIKYLPQKLSLQKFSINAVSKTYIMIILVLSSKMICSSLLQAINNFVTKYVVSNQKEQRLNHKVTN